MHETVTGEGGSNEKHVDPGVLRKIGIVAIILVVVIVVWGLVSRHRSHAKLNDWTQAQATPTVTVITPKGTAQRAAAGDSLTLPATVQAYNSAPIYARTSGYVQKWLVDIGATVKRGQLLATIDAPEVEQQLNAAQADLKTAKANEALAGTTAGRWQELLKDDAVSKQATDERTSDLVAKKAVTGSAAAEVERLRALLGFTRILSPFDGVVTSRSTQIGQLVSAGSSAPTPLFTVSDISKMRIYVRVPQYYVSQVKVGQHVAVSLPEYPDRTFDTELVSTAHAIDQQSGTILVELQTANSDGALNPGSYGQARFPISAAGSGVIIPASAVLYRSDGTRVATVDAQNKVHLHDIKIGRDMGDTLEVSAGILANDRVIDSPPDAIREGDSVSIRADTPKAKGA